VEYFEYASGATAVMDYERIGDVVPADDGYNAEYYDNQNLSGAPVLTRKDPAVNFDWGSGSPGGGGPVGPFSARWTKSVQLPAGSYAFNVTGDDGVRLYLDGQLVLDKWVLESPTTYTVIRQLPEGTHQIVLEYFESGGGAVAKLDWGPSNET